MVQADYFLNPQIYCKVFVNNKPVFDRKLTFIERVLQFSTGGQEGFPHAESVYIIDVVG